MTDPLLPSPALLCKLGSIAVHVDEGLSPGGHEFDWAAARQLINDPDVVEWVKEMQKQAFLPVKRWAIANGDNQELRIALCGYDTEHKMPENWIEVEWKANGGFANQSSKRTRGRENANRERIWFSPHCLEPQGLLFSENQPIIDSHFEEVAAL